jgi:hypothetical protein
MGSDEHGAAAMRGLPYGDKTQLEDQQTYGTGMQSTFQPLQSPVNTPAPQPEWDAGWQPPKEDKSQDIPNVDPATGMNYDEVLQAPTDRPFESVDAGLVGAKPPKVSQTLSQMAQVSDAPDVRALLNAALQLGM